MALSESQQDQVDQLRRLVGVTDIEDDDLYAYVSAADGSINAAAAEVWQRKAAEAADLIDVKEGSSSRPLSQLRGSALAMRDYFSGLAAAETPAAATQTRLGTISRS